MEAESSPDNSVNASPLLAVRGVRKHFSGTVALRGVDFDVRRGEVHALVGENGAGKSTLIKILAGVYPSDAGQILFLGESVERAAARLPIAFIHQELGLAPTLTVGENIAVVAGYPTRLGLIHWRRLRAKAASVLELMGADIDPSRRIEDLSVAERSIVALGRAMGLQRQVVVLDEPTAALPERDVARLFAVLRNIRASGVGIVYVTHRLEEVFRIADRVTVFRDGRSVCTREVSDIDRHELVRQMTGRDLEEFESSVHDVIAEPILQVEELVANHVGPISFVLRPGEILGLVGLRGGGHDVIGRAIYGAVKPHSGSVVVGGRTLKPGDVVASLEHGLGFLSSKRGDEGVAALLSVRENLFLNPILRGGSALRIHSSRRESRSSAAVLERFSVRPREPERLIDTLSGGNQQKVILARWLSIPDRNVLILEEPTAGVDVGARSDIYALLRQATGAGLAVLLISSDFEEVAAIADRALVLRAGRAVAELVAETLTETHLAATAAGGVESDQ